MIIFKYVKALENLSYTYMVIGKPAPLNKSLGSRIGNLSSTYLVNDDTLSSLFSYTTWRVNKWYPDDFIMIKPKLL